LKTIISAPAAAAAVALLLALSGCTESATDTAADNPLLAAPVPDGMVRGTVAESMDVAGYTYVLIDSDGQQLWIAGPETAVEVGDIVQASTRMPMTDFTSETLGRTFEILYFSGSLQNLSAPAPAVESPAPAVESPAPAPAASPAVVDVDVEALEPGQDIAYVYANKDELAGQEISLRGKVVKYNANIMGTNFIHIQDGSGDANEGNNDLTVTSKATTAVGETVVVTGTIILDKDLGSGYTFPVLMDDAALSTEVGL
jgi:hypothetical protein